MKDLKARLKINFEAFETVEGCQGTKFIPLNKANKGEEPSTML